MFLPIKPNAIVGDLQEVKEKTTSAKPCDTLLITIVMAKAPSAITALRQYLCLLFSQEFVAMPSMRKGSVRILIGGD